jgi:ribosomal protein S18 acetylase RimI-like enzyme
VNTSIATSSAGAIATSVRRAQPSDADALSDLVNRAYAIEAPFLEGNRTTSAEIAELIKAGGFLVLEHSDGIGAAVWFEPPGKRAGLPARTAYFGLLSVRPELQGMGLGRRLVQVAEAMAEANGASEIQIRVINLREELSRWYKSLGYCEIGTAPYATPHASRVPKRALHFIEMAKALAPATAQAYAGGLAAVI